ncbi:hypothetical protein Vafri_16530 [Volvox africanus]|uniref:Uncharacterized protein n=1 Tax=Volvox africanus TaxID=51714 RepID=A0A8J4BNQ6_9CHLO|nr:hypothetical protein Vafri_16530 [Volvox africanus]
MAQQMIQNNMEYIRMHEIKTMSDRLARLQRCADVLRVYNSLRATASISNAAGPGPSAATGSHAEHLDVRLFEGLQYALGQPAMQEDIWAAWCMELRRFLWAAESGQLIARHGYLKQAAQPQSQPQEPIEQKQRHLDQEHNCSGSIRGLGQEPEGCMDAHLQQQLQRQSKLASSTPAEGNHAQTQVPAEVLPGCLLPPALPANPDQPQVKLENDTTWDAVKQPWTDDRGRQRETEDVKAASKGLTGPTDTVCVGELRDIPGDAPAAAAPASDPGGTRGRGHYIDDKPEREGPERWPSGGNLEQQECKQGAALPLTTDTAPSDGQQGQLQGRSASQSLPSPRQQRVRGSRSRSRSRSPSPQFRSARDGRGNRPAVPGGRKFALGGDYRCRMPPHGSWNKEEWAREVHRFLQRQPGGSAEVAMLLRAGLAVPSHVLRTSGRSPAAFLCGFPHLWAVSGGAYMVLTALPGHAAAAAGPALPALDGNKVGRTSGSSERSVKGPDSATGGQRIEWSQGVQTEAAIVNRITDYLREVPQGIRFSKLRSHGFNIPNKVLGGRSVRAWAQQFSHLWTITDSFIKLREQRDEPAR